MEPVDAKHAHIAGALVTFFTTLYIEMLFKDVNRTHPYLHVLIVIAGSILTMPYIFLTSPEWYGFPMQLTFNLLVLFLDWFSFYEDKTRFSEKSVRLFGNCRHNARYTGHLAHWGDVLGVMALVVPEVNSHWKVVVTIGLIVYGFVGSELIDTYTKDGSVSHVKRLNNDDDKCKQARLMRDAWRGVLNDLITVLGVGVAWQAIMKCDDGQCMGNNAPMKLILAPFKTTKKTIQHTAKKSDASFYFLMLTVLTTIVPTVLTLITTLLIFIVPTVANFVNTSAQHGLTSTNIYDDLPTCFDDYDHDLPDTRKDHPSSIWSVLLKVLQEMKTSFFDLKYFVSIMFMQEKLTDIIYKGGFAAAVPFFVQFTIVVFILSVLTVKLLQYLKNKATKHPSS